MMFGSEFKKDQQAIKIFALMLLVFSNHVLASAKSKPLTLKRWHSDEDLKQLIEVNTSLTENMNSFVLLKSGRLLVSPSPQAEMKAPTKEKILTSGRLRIRLRDGKVTQIDANHEHKMYCPSFDSLKKLKSFMQLDMTSSIFKSATFVAIKKATPSCRKK